MWGKILYSCSMVLVVICGQSDTFRVCNLGSVHKATATSSVMFCNLDIITFVKLGQAAVILHNSSFVNLSKPAISNGVNESFAWGVFLFWIQIVTKLGHTHSTLSTFGQFEISRMDKLGHLICRACRVIILLLSSTSILGKSKVGRTSAEPDTSSFFKFGRCLENAYELRLTKA
jgi:hypothetical protein